MSLPSSVPPSSPVVLFPAELGRGAAELRARDPAMARIVDEYGIPTPWTRPPGLATLIQIVLEQQVSLASARATYRRLQLLASPLSAESLLALAPEQLRSAGMSQQKARYCHNIAQAIASGELDLDELDSQPDARVREDLTRIKGIGRWTADVYLMMALQRADVWPCADIGLAAAIQVLQTLPKRPIAAEVDLIGEQWRPWRSVAAWLLWHYYLSRQGLPRP